LQSDYSPRHILLALVIWWPFTDNARLSKEYWPPTWLQVH